MLKQIKLSVPLALLFPFLFFQPACQKPAREQPHWLTGQSSWSPSESPSGSSRHDPLNYAYQLRNPATAGQRQRSSD